MAPLSRNGVVGYDLKVHGIPNLRVIDVSICPNLVAGHTVRLALVHPVYAVADRHGWLWCRLVLHLLLARKVQTSSRSHSRARLEPARVTVSCTLPGRSLQKTFRGVISQPCTITMALFSCPSYVLTLYVNPQSNTLRLWITLQWIRGFMTRELKSGAAISSAGLTTWLLSIRFKRSTSPDQRLNFQSSFANGGDRTAGRGIQYASAHFRRQVRYSSRIVHPRIATRSLWYLSKQTKVGVE
jgi:hypothetical protein